ncbi:MAG: flagellar M-ring protein FliF [Alphaproteobacteria bacterium]|nr:flagellar M-ring protein FliF [Alphaproteobacteria bacterium]
MAGLTAAVAGFFMYVMGWMTEPPKALLFSGLDPRDSSEIAARLDATKVPYELQADGSTILVPSDQVLRLRMQFAGDGVPAGGSVGYEIFDRTDAFGQTSFVQNVNLVRALEGELGRTIRSLSSIANARVHLNIPKHELFAEKQADPTASVVIRARGAISPGQVQAIQNLIASAVPGMNAGTVTVIDEKGAMLGGGASQAGGSAVQHDERTASFEERVRKQIDDIITGIAGPGRARVQVSADIDYNRITRETQTFDPDGQVVRSTQTTNADATNQDGSGSQGVTVANALPAGAQDGSSGGAGASSSNDKRSEETVNYEISKTTSTEIQEGGTVKRLSVAVAVDGSYTTDDKGVRTYQPRAAEEMQQIEQLVRSAIGFDDKRGDQLKVVNLRFNQLEPEVLPPVEEPFLGLAKEDIWKIAQFAGLGLIALLLIFFVMRPLITAIGAPQHGGMLASQSLAGPAGAAAAALPGGSQAALSGPSAGALPSPQNVISGVQKMIDIAQVEGQVKESSVRKVGEIVGKHPDEATSIMRQWLHESA